MFDRFHLQITQGDLLRTVATHLDAIGHIRFAAVPDRAEPDHGEVDFAWLLPQIEAFGYEGVVRRRVSVTDRFHGVVVGIPLRPCRRALQTFDA